MLQKLSYYLFPSFCRCFGLVFPSYLHLFFYRCFSLEIPPVFFIDNVHLKKLYATPNILEILKTKIKLHFKEGESPNSISFIYQPSYRIRLIDHDVQRLTSSQPVKIKTQSMQSKGLAVLKMTILSKPRRPLDATTSGAKRFNYFSHNWPKRSSHKEVLTIES